MSELDDRLRTGITALAERTEPTASPDDVIAALGRGSRRSTKIGLRVAVAAAVVLVLVAAIALVRRTEHQAVVNVGPSTTAPSEEWHPTGLAAGWHDLPLGPVESGIAQQGVWTGRQLVVPQWGIVPFSSFPVLRPAAFDAGTNQWFELPQVPGADFHNLIVGGSWTGQEAIFWRSQDIVAWNPATESWRTSSAPHDLQRGAVWTGDELIFWADGLAYDPHEDSWREIARPSDPLVATVVDDVNSVLWFEGQVVIVGGLTGAYDPTTDTWREFGPALSEESGSPGIAFDGFTARAAVIDDKVTAFDASPASAAVLDLEQGTWTEAPELAPPIDPSGWMQVVPFDDGRLLVMGTTDSRLRNSNGWEVFPNPNLGHATGAADAVFLYGEQDGQPNFSIFVPPPAPSAAPWDAASLGPGWHGLDRGPLPADRAPRAMAFSGRELLLFGFAGADDIENRGLAFSPATDQWSEIPAAPLDSLDGLDGMFDGESFVVWSQSGAAFWDPENRTWRAGAPPPRPIIRSTVRVGEIAHASADLVYWADGLAYNMQNDEWREIALPPKMPTRAETVYDGSRLLVVGLADEQVSSVTAQFAYDFTSNTWSELPDPGLDGQSLDLIWLVGRRTDPVVGIDYRGNTVAFDPADNRWRALDPIPFRQGEDEPVLVPVGDGAFLASSWGFAYLDQDLRWYDATGSTSPSLLVASAGSGAFVLGAQFAVYVP